MRTYLLLVMLLPSMLFAQPKMFDPPLSHRIADYTIDCRLDPETKILRATETLRWKNTSSDPINELQFHLYQNGFRDEKSSFLIELGEIPKGLVGNWGYCNILRMELPDGTDLTQRLVYIQPDDMNKYDKTVCSVKLPKNIIPGETIKLKIDFETRLPWAVSRSGFEKSFFSVTQWFPKIGVYEDGEWICHQYHSHGEFYSDFGVYDVTITLPQEYVVGATGIRIEEKNIGNGLKRLRHYCEDVHDFAWCADIDFVEYKERYGDTDIRLLCQKDHVDMAQRFLKAISVTFEYYGSRYGVYPYPIITIIESKHRATGEMEYPTLFQTGNFDTNGDIKIYQSEPLPESDKYIEWLTIHEFGHNWWYGMVANNETDHVWVDEGINTYASTKALEFGYGPYILKNHDGITETAREHDRNIYLNRAKDATILQTSWLFRSWDEFFAFNYCKPEMMLLTLNNYFGEELWDQVMKTFFQRWKFKHPKTEDFYDVVYEVTGKNLKHFFDEYMNTTHTLDFSIEKVEENKVTIQKDGWLRFPVTITFHFADGTQTAKEWENIRNRLMFDFEKSKDITRVVIDPDQIIEFELSRDNNVWIREE